MADYTHYADPDPEWEEFAKTLNSPTIPEDLELAKKNANEGRAKLFAEVLGPVEGPSTKDLSIPTRDGLSINARLYHADKGSGNLPLFIYLHGGGWFFGNVETEDAHCRLLRVNVPCIVLNVDYRHTPRWTFPTANYDVFDAIDWITEPSRAKEEGIDLSKVVVGGVSAGATLAIGAGLHEIEEGKNRVKGLLISIPTTVAISRFPKHLIKNGYTSLEQNSDTVILPITLLEFFYDLYKGDPDHPYYSPLLLPDSAFKGKDGRLAFPRSAFTICGADPLRDSGLLYEEKVRKLGVETRLEVYKGWPHAFWNQPQIKSSARFRKRLIEDAKWLFEN